MRDHAASTQRQRAVGEVSVYQVMDDGRGGLGFGCPRPINKLALPDIIYLVITAPQRYFLGTFVGSL